MSRITADELPIPFTAVAPWEVAAQSARRRSAGFAMWAASGLAVFAFGVLAVHGLDRRGEAPGNDNVDRASSDNRDSGNDDSGNDSSGDGGSAGNATLSDDQLDAAYVTIFGTPGSGSTLDCIARAVGEDGGQAARLARGEMLTFPEAQAAFTPFVDCAPDVDFLAGMVPATLQALNQPADQTCIEENLAMFNVADRAEALALALTDIEGFSNALMTYFLPCTL